MKTLKLFIAMFATLFLASCNNYFEFSPYDANVDQNLKNQTGKNINALIQEYTKSNKPFSFITIADSHYNFKDLQKAVNKINELDSIDFVVHLGDMTDKGLLTEYEMFSDEIKRLNVSVFTCIGNHDYLSNGGTIYNQMFGDYNYSFEYKGRKFIFFDATTFESGKTPDMNWLTNELQNSNHPKIIFSHIPPGDDQYSPSDAQKYIELVDSEGVVLSMHGHHHDYYYGTKLNSELEYLIPGSVDNRNICKVTISADNTYSFELISF